MSTQRSRQGFLIVTTLLVVVGLTLLMTVGLTRSATDLHVAQRFIASQKAFALAEAGVECAIRQLRLTGVEADVFNACMTPGAPPTPLALSTGTAGLDPILPPDAAGVYTLTGTGTAAPSRSTVTVKVKRTPGSSPFLSGIFGSQPQDLTWSVRLRGTAPQVDSYDSALGDYGKDLSASPDPVYELWNKSQYDPVTESCIGCNAEVRTNGTIFPSGTGTEHALEVREPGKIFGTAVAPTGASVQEERSATTGVLNIIGGVGRKPIQPLPMPEAPGPPAGCGPPPWGDQVVSGGVTTESGTTYCYDSLEVEAGATLSLPSLATLYVTGQLMINGTLQAGQGTIQTDYLWMPSAGGGARTLEGTNDRLEVYTHKLKIFSGTLRGKDKLPANLRIYNLVPDTYGWVVAPDSVIYGVLYTTASDLTLMNNVSLFGAAICKRCTLQDNLWVHQDTTLRTVVDWPAWLTTTTVTVLAQY